MLPYIIIFRKTLLNNPIPNQIPDQTILFLQHQALQLRIDSIRATTQAQSGHPTSCMSAADIVSALFFYILIYDIKNPKNPNNDRFILSKGHAVPVMYAAWKQLGVITDEQLLSLRDSNSIFEGHPTPKFIYNEAATGSLGQGLSIGLGMALNAIYEKLSYKTYVMLGDAELAEGSVWEAAELASHKNINNLIGIIDCNRLGQSGESIDNHHVDVYAKKFQAFGWDTIIINGHNMREIIQALEQAQASTNKPFMIIAKTFKGYGLVSTQNKENCHGKPFKKEELPGLINELKETFKDAAEFTITTRYTPPVPANTNSETPAKQAQKISLDLTHDKNNAQFDPSKKISSRKAFGYALAALGRADKRVFALDADVKNSTYTEIFETEFPDRFVECFIAEQNMISIAAGLQARGKIPFAATFGAFFTRCYDQIRMAAIGQNAIRLCGSHCGVSIGQDGPSQMALEDLAIMRAIPNSIVLYPSDGVSTYKLTELMANYNNGISYIRSTRADTNMLYTHEEKFVLGGSKVLRTQNNNKACIVTAGITLHEALKAYEILKAQNIFVSIIDLYSIKPLDTQTLITQAQQANNHIITIEDHYPQGGIGEAVTHALANTGIQVHSLAVNQLPHSGTPEDLLRWAGIDADSIVRKVQEL